MRIALASDWYLPRLGGVELQLDDLASSLRARGHEAVIITGTAGPSSAEVCRLPIARLPIAGVALPAGLRAALREQLRVLHPDVVHAHVSVVSPVAYAAILAAHDLALPTVVTFHSALHASARFLALADRLVDWQRWPLVVTAVSALVARQLNDAMPNLAVHRLANGVSREQWRAPAAGKAQDGRVRLVSALRLHRKKRPFALLRAFAALRDAIPETPIQLAIHGDGPQRAALERAIRRTALADCVSLAGWSSREELARSYAQADGFVLPTVREAFGIAALEARCAGLPVIAMRAAGVTDFLTHGYNALLADDDQELGMHLQRLVRDSALRVALASASEGLDRFDWPQVASQHLDCYGRAIVAATARSPLRPNPT